MRQFRIQSATGQLQIFSEERMRTQLAFRNGFKILGEILVVGDLLAVRCKNCQYREAYGGGYLNCGGIHDLVPVALVEEIV